MVRLQKRFILAKRQDEEKIYPFFVEERPKEIGIELKVQFSVPLNKNERSQRLHPNAQATEIQFRVSPSYEYCPNIIFNGS